MSSVPRWFITSAIVILACLIVGSTFLVFAYGITRHQWSGSATRSFAALTHFPAARVDTIRIPYTDYLALMDAQKILLTTEVAKQQQLDLVPEQDRRKGVLDTLLRNAVTEIVAQEAQIELTPLDVDRFYEQLVGLAATSTTSTATTVQEVTNYLREHFNWTPKEYKKYVVRSGMLRDILSQKREQAGEQVSIDDLITQRLTQPNVKRYLQL